jgi:hypothetical protein
VRVSLEMAGERRLVVMVNSGLRRVRTTVGHWSTFHRTLGS